MKHRNEIDRCENCEFAEYKDKDEWVECRRNAPIPGEEAIAIWSLTNKKMWCGEFKRRQYLSNRIVKLNFVPDANSKFREKYELYQKMKNGKFFCQSCGANKQHFVKDLNASKDLGAPRIAIRCNGCDRTSSFYCSVLNAINEVFGNEDIFKEK